MTPRRKRKPRRDRINWSDTPIEHIQLATCAHCGATQYEFVRCQNQGDGSVLQKRICLECSGAYRVVLEFPESMPLNGNDDFDFD